jgi:hypothetical protein
LTLGVCVLACSVAVTPPAEPLTMSAVGVAGATVTVVEAEVVEGAVVEALDAVVAGRLVEEAVEAPLEDFPQPPSTSTMSPSPTSGHIARLFI